MANQFKGLWLIILLVAGGVAIFYLGSGQGKPQAQEGVVLQEVFNQKPLAADQGTGAVESPNTSKAVDPIPAMAIVTSPVGGHEAGFTIQVYSFQDKGRAEAALANLKKEGYQAFMIISDLGEKGTWYRIRVGGIADDAAAKQVLEKIRKSYNSGFIVKPVK